MDLAGQLALFLSLIITPNKLISDKPVVDFPPLDWVPGGSHFVAVEPICRPTERSGACKGRQCKQTPAACCYLNK
jgi:hypothetical protein